MSIVLKSVHPFSLSLFSLPCIFLYVNSLLSLNFHFSVPKVFTHLICIRHGVKNNIFLLGCGRVKKVVRNIRKELVLARLRLGHTRVTHSYLLLGEEQLQCAGCDASFTIRHFLLECGDFAQVRNNCFHVETVISRYTY